MKILKRVLLAIGLLIVLLLITALFVKKDYAVERATVINQPKSEVFTYVKFLKNQGNYSKWATMDPDMKTFFRGVDGTVGFVSAWDSENDEVGKGEQEITGITEGKRIDYELRFIEPFESNEKAYMITEKAPDNKTLVKWGFKGHMGYPSNLFMLFMDFDQMLGNDLEEGLQNLKTLLENQ